jgi:DNA repair exonuclease SbcCD ATPase subunit
MAQTEAQKAKNPEEKEKDGAPPKRRSFGVSMAMKLKRKGSEQHVKDANGGDEGEDEGQEKAAVEATGSINDARLQEELKKLRTKMQAEADKKEATFQTQLDEMKKEAAAAKKKAEKTAALLERRETELKLELAKGELGKKDVEGQVQEMQMEREKAKQAAFYENKLELEKQKSSQEKQTVTKMQAAKDAAAEQARKSAKEEEEKKRLKKQLTDQEAAAKKKEEELQRELDMLNGEMKMKETNLELEQTKVRLQKKEMAEAVAQLEAEKRQLEIEIDTLVKTAKGGSRGKWDSAGESVVLKAKKMAAKNKAPIV